MFSLMNIPTPPAFVSEPLCMKLQPFKDTLRLSETFNLVSLIAIISGDKLHPVKKS